MTQNEEIAVYIRENGSITPLDALREFGCYRLAARISDLKRDGIPIKVKIESYRTQKGKVKRYARYSL